MACYILASGDRDLEADHAHGEEENVYKPHLHYIEESAKIEIVLVSSSMVL